MGEGHRSCLTNKTQRGKETCPRAHSKSAAEPGLASSPPDPSGVLCLIPGGLAAFRPEASFRPQFSSGGGSQHLSLTGPFIGSGSSSSARTGGPALPGSVSFLPSPGLSPRHAGCPSRELWLPKETGRLFGFPCFGPDCPAPPGEPQDASQRWLSEGLRGGLRLTLDSSLP